MQILQSGQGINLAILLALAGLPQVASSQSLTASETEAIKRSGEWQTRDATVTRGSDGKVLFAFGQSQPSVVCAPLQVCDMELETQETVRDVLLGDTVRWNVEAASSGEGREQRIHLIIRPTEADLETSMIVTTSRRTYHVKLVSHESRYMARIGFSYPGTPIGLAEINARLGAREQAASASGLDFRYHLSGQARWRPTRVYSDGSKTYVQFPATVSGQDIPVLFIIADGQRQIVNYRLAGQTMVVDYLIDKAVLVSGVGWRQKKITITRGG